MKETIIKLTEELKAFNESQASDKGLNNLMFDFIENGIHDRFKPIPMDDSDKALIINYEIEFNKLLMSIEEDVEGIMTSEVGGGYTDFNEMVAIQKESLQELEDMFFARMYLKEFDPINVNKLTITLRKDLVISGYKFINQSIEKQLRSCF